MKPFANPFFRPSIFATFSSIGFCHAHVASINWGTSTTISACAQVLAAGSLAYGYLGSNATTTINTVLFAARGVASASLRL